MVTKCDTNTTPPPPPPLRGPATIEIPFFPLPFMGARLKKTCIHHESVHYGVFCKGIHKSFFLLFSKKYYSIPAIFFFQNNLFLAYLFLKTRIFIHVKKPKGDGGGGGRRYRTLPLRIFFAFFVKSTL